MKKYIHIILLSVSIGLVGCDADMLIDDSKETYILNPIETSWVDKESVYTFETDGTITIQMYNDKVWEGNYMFDNNWVFVYDNNNIIKFYGTYKILGETLTINTKGGNAGFTNIKLQRNYD